MRGLTVAVTASAIVTGVGPHPAFAEPTVATSDAAATSSPLFVQGLVGYSSPVAGEQYMDGVASGAARVGIRAGFTPLRVGHLRFGVEAGIDWRPLDITNDDGTVQHFRALVGPRVAFVGDRHTVFFRAVTGYDHLALGGDANSNGYAFEPGFGASYRHAKLVFGAEVAVPIIVHRQHTGDDYMDGFVGVDLQLMLSAGAEL